MTVATREMYVMGGDYQRGVAVAAVFVAVNIGEGKPDRVKANSVESGFVIPLRIGGVERGTIVTMIAPAM